MLPVNAMSITKLNAVPEISLYILPVKPSITGNPGDNPAPIKNSPKVFI